MTQSKHSPYTLVRTLASNQYNISGPAEHFIGTTHSVYNTAKESAREAQFVVDALNAYASQSSRIAELEGALQRAERLMVQWGPKDIDEWDGYQAVRRALLGGGK
jgi:hypothetical protein